MIHCSNDYQNFSLGEIVKQNSAAASVFEEYGMDYCCGGKQTLKEACFQANYSLGEVSERIENITQYKNNWDCPKESLTDLCNHIEELHHRHLENLLPDLEHIIQKVNSAHGEKYPFLNELLSLFKNLHIELMQHMAKEEQVLFPYCKILEKSKEAQSFHCASIGNPIRVMLLEHDNAGEVLTKIRQLTSNYDAPHDVCNTYRLMMEELKAFELDMKQHIHKENNVLFPLALEAENKLIHK